jgi:hypothetical protein
LIHKFAALRFLINKLKAYQLKKEGKKKEVLYIKNILDNNSCPLQLINKFLGKHGESINIVKVKDHLKQREKQFNFSFFGKETYYIRSFQTAILHVACRTKCYMKQLLNLKSSLNDENKFQGSGIYQLTCGDCSKKYKGQRDSSFETRYKEYLHLLRSNNTNSKFAHHLLENSGALGKKDGIMEIM